MKRTISLVLVLALGLATEIAGADFTFGTPTNLGPTVNSSDVEAEPSISVDGLILIFMSNRSGGYGQLDLWMTTRATTIEPWGEPVNLGPSINSPKWDWCPSLSPDGCTLYFSSNRSGGYGEWDIWMATRATTDDAWGEPVNLGPTINHSGYDHTPFISEDGLELYFCSYRRSGGYGSDDIWVSAREAKQDEWGTPMNLGPIVNSAHEELWPTLSADGLLLFFSSGFWESGRPGGLGKSDIWMARRKSRDADWGEPVNLGSPVNSPDHDWATTLTADGCTLYFCSNNRPGGLGQEDIWQAPVIPPIAPPAWMMAPASNPSPANRATDVPRDVVLSWRPGIFAPPVNGHKVYLSENFNDVNDGVGGIAQDANCYALPQRLDFGTTYYWRVDEVNGPPDYTVYEGDVWSFTTEPVAYPIDGNNITATASSVHQADMGPEKTIDGSGLDANDLHSTEETAMWLSSMDPLGAWIEYQFDKAYKLHEMWVWNSNQAVEPMLGFGLKDVTIEYSTNGSDYITLGTTHEFARGPGMPDYAHNTTIDFGGAVAKYVKLTANSNWGGIMPQYGLSEVRFFYIPVRAREPNPDSEATDVDLDVTLGFRAGREAAQHDLYLSTDEQTVIDGNAPVATVTETSYGPLSLDLARTYYWKINEVNMAETPTTWQGDIWNFATREFIIVDDFESYNDLKPEDPESNRIFNSWIDGYQQPTNGAIVGYTDSPFCERTIVHGGKQSMPFFYSNTGGAVSSEAELTLTLAQDWTASGVVTLAVHFHGTEGNTGQLYVKINGAKVPYDGQASNLALTGWQAWNIDLASSGASLQNVTKLAVGIDGNGASGTLYIDDIGLYPYSREFITPSAPDDTRLIGYWKFDGDTQDSSGRGNHGTAGVTPAAFVAGKVGSNAMEFRGADYVVIDGVVDDITSTNITLSAWIKTTQGNEGNVFAANTAVSSHPFMFGVTGGSPFVNDGSDTQFPPPVNDDLWHLITYVRDGNTGYIYADGFLRGAHSAGFSLASITRWSIGQEWDNAIPSDFYTGTVDDVRIYDYPLSEGEVAWLAGKTQPFDKPF
jgi:hypothetical protein